MDALDETPANQFLAHCADWKGSEVRIAVMPDGSMAGAHVNLYVPDPHRLRTLLTYLGVPKDAINAATGFGR